MKAVVLLSLLCLGSWLQATADTHPIDQLVKLLIVTISLALKHKGTIDIPVTNLSFNQTSSIEGILICERVDFYGLEGLDLTFSDIILESDIDSDHVKIKFDLPISFQAPIGIRVENYLIDMALFKEVPVYGYGNVSLELDSVDLEIGTEMKYENNKLNMANFKLKFAMSSAKFTISKFWDNDELSATLSGILTDFLEVFVLFYRLERDCISCVLSTVIETWVNHGDYIDDLATQCKEICLPSSYAIVGKVFDTNMQQHFSRDNLIRYLKMAVEHVLLEIERRL